MKNLIVIILCITSFGCSHNTYNLPTVSRTPASLYEDIGNQHLIFKRDIFEGTNAKPTLECLVYSNGRVLTLKNDSLQNYAISFISRDLTRTAAKLFQLSAEEKDANAGGGQGGGFAKLVYYFQPKKLHTSKQKIFSMWLNYDHGPSLLDGKEGEDFKKGIKLIDRLCTIK